ncbi:unnamed protein product [Moneuplotes crassus]|uniref:Uncharacterized protein n=1 Tax=Euplotes crassus TaxID=5936 RepID=A0AAD1X679_EUPCR|nr:unnamed protein product [Moneuplotes crassus]
MSETSFLLSLISCLSFLCLNIDCMDIKEQNNGVITLKFDSKESQSEEEASVDQANDYFALSDLGESDSSHQPNKNFNNNLKRRSNKYQSLYQRNRDKIRKLTKPVLNELKKGISNVHGHSPSFGFAPVIFNQKADSYWGMISKDIFSSKGKKNLHIRKLLQEHDIAELKQKMVLDCFTFGQKLSNSLKSNMIVEEIQQTVQKRDIKDKDSGSKNRHKKNKCRSGYPKRGRRAFMRPGQRLSSSVISNFDSNEDTKENDTFVPDERRDFLEPNAKNFQPRLSLNTNINAFRPTADGLKIKYGLLHPDNDDLGNIHSKVKEANSCRNFNPKTPKVNVSRNLQKNSLLQTQFFPDKTMECDSSVLWNKASMKTPDKKKVKNLKVKKSTIKSFHTFLMKDPVKRKNKALSTSYVLKSLMHSIKNNQRIFLGKERVKNKVLFKPKISLKSRRIQRPSSVAEHTKSSLAKFRTKVGSNNQKRENFKIFYKNTRPRTQFGSSLGMESLSTSLPHHPRNMPNLLRPSTDTSSYNVIVRHERSYKNSI